MSAITAEITDVFARFEIDPKRGFLFPQPLNALPETYESWENIASQLPQLLKEKSLRDAILQLKEIPITDLRTLAQQERAMLILSMLGNAYVQANGEEVKKIPAQLAVPWASLAANLDRPAILHHASYALYNWRLVDASKDVIPENFQTLLQFNNHEDERWFCTVTTAIEAKGGEILPWVVQLAQLAKRRDTASMKSLLEQLAMGIDTLTSILRRMYEHCRPDVFFSTIRPYLASFQNVIFEGVSDQPVRNYHGGSAAQSTLIQSFDALLGVKHPHPSAGAFLKEMRKYMPPKHAAFLAWLEEQTAGFEWQKVDELANSWKEIIRALTQFRNEHLKIAATYIAAPARKTGQDGTGTGGTNPLVFLKQVRNDTAKS